MNFDPAQNLRSDIAVDSKRNGSIVTSQRDLHERRNGIVSIVAQTPSHRNESADVFAYDAATLSLRSSRSCYVLHVLTTTKALPQRLEFLGIENLGASVTLLLRSYCALVALVTFQLRLWYAIGD